MKLFRRMETGLSPDLELSAHLARQHFDRVPALVGAIEYRRPGEEPWAVAMLQVFVPNQGDAWQYTLARLDRLLSGAASADVIPPAVTVATGRTLVTASTEVLPANIKASLGPFIAEAATLGERTAGMHLALAGGSPDFGPEPFTPDDLAAFCKNSRALVSVTMALLRKQAAQLPAEMTTRAAAATELEASLLARFDGFATEGIAVHKIRCHGDYHLGQVLVDDGDFYIIDFEGEPARPLAERRKKNLALRDVAGMIRSFHYASCAAAVRAKSADSARSDQVDRLTAAWYFWASTSFLRRLSPGGRPSAVRAGKRRAVRRLARRVPAGESDLRAALRAQQPTRLGPFAAGSCRGLSARQEGSQSYQPPRWLTRMMVRNSAVARTYCASNRINRSLVSTCVPGLTNSSATLPPCSA